MPQAVGQHKVEALVHTDGRSPEPIPGITKFRRDGRVIWPRVGVFAISALTLVASACTDATTKAVSADAASIGVGTDASTVTTAVADAIAAAAPDSQGGDANEATVDGARVSADLKADAIALPCALPCAAGDPCHVSSCDASAGQCVDTTKPNGAICDDGNPCTVDDACQSGACVAGKLGGTCQPR